jgi:hypothetical protein
MEKIKYNPLLKYGFQEVDSSGGGGGGAVDVVGIMEKEILSRSSGYEIYLSDDNLLAIERMDIVEDLSCVYVWVELIALKDIAPSGANSLPNGQVFSIENPSVGAALQLPDAGIHLIIREKTTQAPINTKIKAFYANRHIYLYDIEPISEGSTLFFSGTIKAQKTGLS